MTHKNTYFDTIKAKYAIITRLEVSEKVSSLKQLNYYSTNSFNHD
jgi:hypothetical protein